MKPWEIKLNDWQRILFGNAPAGFIIEVVLRTLIIYLFLLIIVRALGKRMSGQLTLTEMAVMLTLGAIVSVPMQTPDRGILQGILILVCALLFHRGFNYIGAVSGPFELLTQGQISMLVKDGFILTEEMRKARISREQLFAELRSHNVRQLGEVQRVYLEAGGFFSIFLFSEPKPGLPLFSDYEVLWGTQMKKDNNAVCCHCGTVFEKNIKICPVCKAENLTESILI